MPGKSSETPICQAAQQQDGNVLIRGGGRGGDIAVVIAGENS